MISSGYMLDRVARFIFPTGFPTGSAICPSVLPNMSSFMASIRKKWRSFEVRIKVSGGSKSKTFATLQQCRTWARFADTGTSRFTGTSSLQWATVAPPFV
jgi:hypothetical protein